MNLVNKKLYINNLKLKLELLIKNSLDDITNDLVIIKSNLEEHYSFINFIESIKLYEIYRWERMKQEYNKIKKKVNIDKKLYPNIIKIYGIVNSYYSSDDHENNNKMIIKIREHHNILLIEWNQMNKIHNDLIIKRKSYMKNNNIIKITQENNDSNNLIEKLYDIHYNLKQIKSELKILKYNKKINLIEN